MTRYLVPILVLTTGLASVGCDLRSGIAKDNMEKYTVTPTPSFAPVPTEAPVDARDVLQTDITQTGDTISVAVRGEKKNLVCAKYNRVLVNGSANTLSIKGACRQIMLNGDRNTVRADGAMEFVFNGSENDVRYFFFLNGKRPSIVENQAGNQIAKADAESSKSGGSR